jgi:Kef-type K+ transport system membrane component KefB
MASFGQLTLIILAGLFGPLLSVSRKVVVPVVVGELLAGVALGKTGAGLIKADNATISFMGNMGFAVLMMGAGMHVPLRNKALIGSLGRGAIAVVASGALGAGAGLVIAHGLSFGHPAVWTILLATGSAAIVLPALDEAGVSADRALLAMAWATVADVCTIVAVPLVMNPSKAVHAALGALAVAGAAVAVLIIARVLQRLAPIQDLRSLSAPRSWALDLRVSLVALFALCALAQGLGISIMIAGFAAGLIVAVEGGPARLSDQVSGVAAGFLVPIFFVVLGASLDIRALVRSATDLELAAALIVGMVAVHALAGLLIRAPLWTSLIVTAQLGVPVAVVKLGLVQHVIKPGEGGAIIAGALASLGICAAGTAIARRAAPSTPGGNAGATTKRGRSEVASPPGATLSSP